jgi:iron complex outermembrane receptor protein
MRLAYALIGLLALPAFAEVSGDFADATEKDFISELPVIYSVTRLPQAVRDVPAAVTVIDRDMIRQSGVRHIADLMRLVPGMQVSHIPGGEPSTGYHGLIGVYPRHMQVLLDGRSQYSPFFVGGVNWNLIPVSLDDIERIEVVRGSNAAAFGSNAVLGAINIVTRAPAETPGLTMALNSGNDHVNDKSLRLASVNGDLAVRATAETRFDEGFKQYFDNTEQHLFDVRADLRLGLRDELQMQFGGITTTQQVGSDPQNAAQTKSNPWREQEKGHSFIQLGWRHTIDASEELNVRFYRTDEYANDTFVFRKNYTGIAGTRTIPVDYGFRAIRNNLEVTHTFSPGQDTRLVWGGEVRSDSVTGLLWFDRPDAVSLFIGRAFGNLEWRPRHDWVVNAGGTWEYDTNSKTTFSPRLGVNWHATPEQTWRAGLARSYRTPSLFEQHGRVPERTSSRELAGYLYQMYGHKKPEIVTTRELGWAGDFKRYGLSGDVRAFNELLRNRLLAVPTTLKSPDCPIYFGALACGANAYSNDMQGIENIQMRGVEYQARWQPADSTRLTVNQAFVHMKAFLHLSEPDINAAFTADMKAKELAQANNLAPRRTRTVMASQTLPGGLEVSAIHHSIGAIRWTNGSYTQAYHRLDWRLAYPFRVGPTRGELALTVQSDGNAHVERTADGTVNPRGYFTLRLEY